MAIAAVTNATKYHFAPIDPARIVPGASICPASLNSTATRSPLQSHHRRSLAWKVSADGYLAIAYIEPLRGSQKLQLTGFFQPGILLRSRRLRRTHRLPRAVRIAVRVVDAVVLQQHLLYSRWYSRNRHFH